MTVPRMGWSWVVELNPRLDSRVRGHPDIPRLVEVGRLVDNLFGVGVD